MTNNKTIREFEDIEKVKISWGVQDSGEWCALIGQVTKDGIFQVRKEISPLVSEGVLKFDIASLRQDALLTQLQEIEENAPVLPPESKEYSQGWVDCNEEWLATINNYKSALKEKKDNLEK